MLYRLQLYLISLVLFQSVVESRKCYQCTSIEACKDPKVVTCEKDGQGCAKITWPGNEIKDCMGLDENKNPVNFNKCENDDSLGFTALKCGCMGKDLCNSSGKPSILTVSMIFVTILCFLKVKNLF